MTDAASVLAALDFTPGPPQCECNGCGPHRGPCHQTATYHVKLHAFGFCNQPGLDHGFAVQLLCPTCLSTRAWQIGTMIDRANTIRRTLGQAMACGTCGMEITTAETIWEARPLNA